MYLQVKNILLTIYKYTYYLIYFQIITVEYIDHVVICIFHVLICTDHVVVCRIIQYANKNSSATDKVFMRYRSIIYLGRSGQPSRFLCQVRRPTLRDSLSSLNGYSCKTRKRSRRKGLPYSLPIEVGRLYGLYPNVLVAIKSIILVFPARMLASRSGSLRSRPRATHHHRIAFLSRSGSPDSRGIP